MSEVKEEDVYLAIVRKPDEPPYPWYLPKDEIDELQALVGGCFQMIPGETVGLPAGVDLWCNEEGKLSGLYPNLNIGFDIVVGTVVIKAADDDGRPRNLEDLEVVRVTEWLAERML